MSKHPWLPLACAPLFLAGCGLSGTYPSLAPRPEELGQSAATPPDAPSPATRPADPALASQVAQLIASGVAGESAFRAALPRTEQMVAGAGKPGSDAWAEAQQALSRLEAARAPTTAAAAELDALARARSQSGAPADLEAIAAAADQLRLLITPQDEAIGRLSASLGTP